MNLDPTSSCTDIQLWDALKLVRLKTYFLNRIGGLSQRLSEGGNNLRFYIIDCVYLILTALIFDIVCYFQCGPKTVIMFGPSILEEDKGVSV